MFTTSKDILFLVLSGAAGLLAIFLAWLIAECALMLRNANRMIHETRDKVHAIEAALGGIRDKLEHSAGYLALIAEGAKQVIRMVMESREKPKTKKPKTEN